MKGIDVLAQYKTMRETLVLAWAFLHGLCVHGLSAHGLACLLVPVTSVKAAVLSARFSKAFMSQLCSSLVLARMGLTCAWVFCAGAWRAWSGKTVHPIIISSRPRTPRQVYLCHLDYEDTEGQMLDKLRLQVGSV